MMKHAFLFMSVLCVTTNSVVGLLDPISVGLTAGAAFGFYKFDFIKDQTICRVTECCNERHIPADIEGLAADLRESLHGQHLVIQHLIPALRAHFSGNRNSRKPLVISLHGTPGTGKNFVSDKIAKHIYQKGIQSKFVRRYMGRADFTVAADVEQYNARIVKEVRETLAQCPRSLFIFDEVDKIPPLVFESLTALVNYNTNVYGADSTQAIFIFLSNTAAVHISDKLGQLIKGGTLRQDTKLSDFEQILEKGAYNLEGGFKKTSLIESHVIDHFLPFLPLEKLHVYKCVKSEFKNWGLEPDDNVAESIVNDIITYDRTHGIFATSGCKKVHNKVGMEVMSQRT